MDDARRFGSPDFAAERLRVPPGTQNGASARARSSAVAKRSAGALRRQRMTISSSSGGTSGRSERSGGGSPCSTSVHTCAMLSAMKGGRPASMS